MPRSRRGFTLVELMIVVAIIGVLAALAIFGVRRYLAAAKSAEAKFSVGAISRCATAAYKRERIPSEQLSEGTLSSFYSHNLCLSANAVPLKPPAARKYQPITSDGKDFGTGSPTIGWKCLRFRIDEPIYYQLKYTKGSSPFAPTNPAKCASAECFEAAALGDLDGDTVLAVFAHTGFVNVKTSQIRTATSIFIEREAE